MVFVILPFPNVFAIGVIGMGALAVPFAIPKFTDVFAPFGIGIGAKSKKLSNDYVVIREHTGGASCCFIVHAFQTKPTFKKLLEHNNDFFDMTEVIHGEHTLELHKEPLFSVGSSAHPKYNPGIFNLKNNDWE